MTFGTFLHKKCICTFGSVPPNSPIKPGVQLPEQTASLGVTLASIVLRSFNEKQLYSAVQWQLLMIADIKESNDSYPFCSHCLFISKFESNAVEAVINNDDVKGALSMIIT